MNAMSMEEREISRERNNRAELESIDLLAIKQRKYFDNGLDFDDSEFLEGFFRFD